MIVINRKLRASVRANDSYWHALQSLLTVDWVAYSPLWLNQSDAHVSYVIVNGIRHQTLIY